MKYFIFALAFLVSSAALADGRLKDRVENLNQNYTAPDTGDLGIYYDLSADDYVKFDATAQPGSVVSGEISLTSAELNAGGIVYSPAAGQSIYQMEFDILPDAEVTTCTDIRFLDDGIAGHTGIVTLDLPSGFGGDGGAVRFSSSGFVSYSSSNFNGTTAGEDIIVDNVGSACAGADNYQINYQFHLAD